MANKIDIDELIQAQRDDLCLLSRATLSSAVINVDGAKAVVGVPEDMVFSAQMPNVSTEITNALKSFTGELSLAVEFEALGE